MPQYILAPAADRDIASMLAWTHQQFGEQARLRYEALIVRAIVDVAERPERGGSSARPEIQAAARTYHLLHSRARVKGIGRVKHPRHFLLYRVNEEGQVEIGRVLHDSMDFERHLPDEYRSRAR
jgi:toxin ParE1/3/4